MTLKIDIIVLTTLCTLFSLKPCKKTSLKSEQQQQQQRNAILFTTSLAHRFVHHTNGNSSSSFILSYVQNSSHMTTSTHNGHNKSKACIKKDKNSEQKYYYLVALEALTMAPSLNHWNCMRDEPCAVQDIMNSLSSRIAVCWFTDKSCKQTKKNKTFDIFVLQQVFWISSYCKAQQFAIVCMQSSFKQ